MKSICEALEPRRMLAAFVEDNSFGSGGSLDIHDAQIGDDPTSQTLLDSQGRVLIVNTFFATPGGEKELAIRRYHADGTVDKTFDGNGELVIDVGSAKQATPLIALLPDNSIVIAPLQAQQPLLQRYTVKGKFAGTFNTDGARYKPFKPGSVESIAQKLYTDSAGRVIFEQYVTSVDQDPIVGKEFITARISRYLPDGAGDTTFGIRGGMSISQAIDSPASYQVQGKFLNRRGVLDVYAPQIDSDNDVIFAGDRYYARGTNTAGNVRSDVDLPFIYSFNGTGAANRSLVADLDLSNAKFVGQKLQYTGVQAAAQFVALTPDNTLDLYGGQKGLAVFKPKGGTFVVSGFDSSFDNGAEARAVQVFGDTAWVLTQSVTINGGRLTALQDDATAGDTIGLTDIFLGDSTPLTFLGVEHNQPQRIIGFTDSQEQAVASLNLTEQEGSTDLVNGVLHITGTAGGDYITVAQRSNGRYVVTGAGPTHSFAAASVSSFQVDALGGDDFVTLNSDDLNHLPLTQAKDVVMNGDAGDDTLFGGAGNDLIDGGSGNDSVMSGNGNDTLSGQSGNDTLIGGNGPDQISGGSGADESVRTMGNTYDSIETFVSE